MDKALLSIGAVLVGAGLSGARKPKAAAAGVAAGLVPLITGIVLNARRARQQR